MSPLAVVSAAAAVVLAAGAADRPRPRRAPRPLPVARPGGRGRQGLLRPFARLLERRDERRIGEELPEFIEGLARSVRSGSSVRLGLISAASRHEGPLGADLAQLAEGLDDGVALDMALTQWRSRRAGVHGIGLVIVAVTIASRSGGSVARALDGVADTVRGEQQLRAEVRALAAQAEASAMLIALLPIAFTMLAAAADPRAIGWLTNNPTGLACLGAGLVLDGVAWWWMHHITAGIDSR